MNNAANLSQDLRDGLWTECTSTATSLDNILSTNGELSPYESFYGHPSKIMNNLRTFGELGIVKTASKTQSKIVNRGEACIFVGYPSNHPSSTYRMLNLRTHKVIISRDIIWMHKMHGEDKSTPNIDDHHDELLDEPDVTPDTPISQQTPAIPAPNIPRELRNLQSDLAPNLLGPGNRPTGRERAALVLDDYKDKDKAFYEELQNLLPDFAFTAAMMTKTMEPSEAPTNEPNAEPTELNKEPSKFREAWDHEDPEQRQKWRDAIRKELRDMTNRGVFRKVKRASMPQGKRCVKNKWVFKVKRNGVFRARLVACGYSQIPGVDFQEHFAPVVNDTSYRIMIATMMLMGLKAKIVDIETAFLHGNLEEEIYMDAPEGIGATKDEVVKLEQTIYGLVQSARQFWKKLRNVLKSIGFEGGDIDPCLLFKRTKDGLVLIGLYVDDLLIIGSEQDMDVVIKDIEKHFKIKIEGDLKDYLSCEIRFSKDGKQAWIGQPHLIKKMEKLFEEEISKKMECQTPGTPGFTIIRDESIERVDQGKQSKYRTGVGMLLFLIKHSRPDIANCTRELSKVLDGATVSAYKEMIRVIKFVVSTKEWGLKFNPTFDKDKKWKLTMYTDSDYGGDKETRISVTGYILFFMGVPIIWKSKSQ